MMLVAGLVLWSGYTLMWWGRNRARGCESTFRELVVPGAYRECSNTPGLTADAASGTGFSTAPTSGSSSNGSLVSEAAAFAARERDRLRAGRPQ